MWWESNSRCDGSKNDDSAAMGDDFQKPDGHSRSEHVTEWELKQTFHYNKCTKDLPKLQDGSATNRETKEGLKPNVM